MNTTYVCIALTLIVYIPFHLFEEALGDFPRWMYEHKWLPYLMSYGHWMANNVFLYYPLVLLASALFVFTPKLVSCGAAVFIWGIINFGDHCLFTIRDRHISPGLWTGLLFLANAIVGLCSLATSLSALQWALGIAIGGVLAGLPIWLCKLMYPFFERFSART